MDSNNSIDEKCESRLYIGNLDLRITEATLIKMFSPFGKIISKDFLWHTRGPKRVSMQEAQLAKEKMHGKLICGRPLVVRLASENYLMEAANCQSAKRAAIKKKLKAMEEESCNSKKLKHGDGISYTESLEHPSTVKRQG